MFVEIIGEFVWHFCVLSWQKLKWRCSGLRPTPIWKWTRGPLFWGIFLGHETYHSCCIMPIPVFGTEILGNSTNSRTFQKEIWIFSGGCVSFPGGSNTCGKKRSDLLVSHCITNRNPTMHNHAQRVVNWLRGQQILFFMFDWHPAGLPPQSILPTSSYKIISWR